MRDSVLLSVLIALVLLSGCIKIEIMEEIDSTGMSTVMMTMEPTNKSAATTSSSRNGEEEEDPCKQLNLTDSRLTDVTCTYDKSNMRVIVRGRFNRLSAGGLRIMGNTYRLDVNEAIEGFDTEEDEEKKATSMPKEKEELLELEEAGVVYNYYVKLPGKVTNQVGGVLQPDGSVKYNLLDMPDVAYVESTTLGGMLPGVPTGGTSGCCCIPSLTLLLAGLSAVVSRAIY
jgi:hypothetical protein